MWLGVESKWKNREREREDRATAYRQESFGLVLVGIWLE